MVDLPPSADNRVSVVLRRPAEPLRAAALALLVEPALLRGLRGRGRAPPPLRPQRLADRLGEALQGELTVAPLAALVLGDGADDRPRLGPDPPLLAVAQRRRGVDVEGRLDPGLGLLGVLAARPTRPRCPQANLGEGRSPDRGGRE